MITLDDILRDLTYGEFANLNIGRFLPDEDESEPDPASYAQLCSWVNLGLKNIYSTFFLASDELIIQQYDAITQYVLSYDYAFSNTGSIQDPKYLIDTVANPWKDNLLKIEAVYDEEGTQLPLNDGTAVDSNNEANSLYTPNYRTLQIPYPVATNATSVEYRAGHEKIVYTSGMDPTGIEIAIPHPLHEALLWYIASRGFASINGDQGQEGNDYYRKFQARVTEVTDQGLYVQDEKSNSRFSTNGWV